MTDEWTHAWSRQVEVPEELIGGSDEFRQVSLWDLLFSREAKSWTRPAGALVRPLFFWDPDLMFGWLHKTWRAEHSMFVGKHQLERSGRALGLRINRTSLSVPLDPIWKDNP